ncbi:hypothetical protein BDV12DRAFT_196198 [Aspergillus spectabilis]
MSRPVRHWPGGIPRTIQPHPNGNLTLDEIKDEVKGWLLYVQESWVPRSSEDDEEYELRQRRALVERWASPFSCIAMTSRRAIVSRKPTNPLSHISIHTQRLQVIQLRTSLFLHLGYQGPYLLVDEDGLQTGLLTVVNFKNSGSVQETLLVRPFNMREPYNWLMTLGKGIEEVSSRDGERRHQNQPIDMGLPILDILCQAKEANQLPTNLALCDREQWQEDLELYAPGYLALEAQGLGGEYDLSQLTEPDMVEGTRKRI